MRIIIINLKYSHISSVLVKVTLLFFLSIKLQWNHPHGYHISKSYSNEYTKYNILYFFIIWYISNHIFHFLSSWYSFFLLTPSYNHLIYHLTLAPSSISLGYLSTISFIIFLTVFISNTFCIFYHYHNNKVRYDQLIFLSLLVLVYSLYRE